ncbi:N-acetylmuramoyl-L-alanine amidase [Companilactobacillus suantsaicola]|uniref:N-acetylmuramoyl-L-alanine amidase n=1 Tax=Companilactobacillus suantsaicola TaxID=2487723 RepID=A0A4Z0JQ64_9LACO|nr:peptidoglycan recognition family protein [Companilactobacillus suantsaicola]TGD24335.1 N-acetylmuramoyl-L-alanine amidase [Companilactobacillus suantsaicola]
MNFNVDNAFALGTYEGSSTRTANKFIVLHETTNIGAKANASYFKNNWSTTQTYVQYVIGDGGKIYQVGADGYQAWGAGSYANANSPVQIELARTTDKATFKKDYATFVNFARSKAREFGIPTTLDAYGNGIKTHKWISDNIWGSHTDPVNSYLEPFWGITHEQLAKDILSGISEPVAPKKTFTNINNVVTVLNGNVKAYATYKKDGSANGTTNIGPGTGWISAGIEMINGKPHYLIGGNIYIPQSITTFNDRVAINSDIPVHAVDHTGKVVNIDLVGGSAWKFGSMSNIPGAGWCYQIATDMFLPIEYAQGSGFKG